jgi:hypothetical protein
MKDVLARYNLHSNNLDKINPPSLELQVIRFTIIIVLHDDHHIDSKENMFSCLFILSAWSRCFSSSAGYNFLKLQFHFGYFIARKQQSHAIEQGSFREESSAKVKPLVRNLTRC